MVKRISKKNPFLAGVLSLFLGPLGYIYLGFNFFVAGLTIALIIVLVLSFLNFPYPSFFNYLQLLVYAYFGYKFAHIGNIFSVEENLSDKDIEEYKSMSFAFYLMTQVMMVLVRFYAFVVGVFMVVVFFSQGRIFKALLMLFLGIAFVQWLLNSIFGFISIGIIRAFRIDKKYL